VQLAEADIRDSIAMTRSMSAKAWELRTTMSLARLFDNQGRRDEARTMLADIYNWFTEGFDTADLKDAKSLLEELNASRALSAVSLDRALASPTEALDLTEYACSRPL
jgi:predicted ATPase